MIQRLSHTTVWVDDQNVAREFYVDKLGMEVRTDHDMGAFRWLTVGPKSQPGFEIILMKAQASQQLSAEDAAALLALARKGVFGAVFDTDDCQATYEELKARGVEFKAPPTKKFYGVEAIFHDPTGNMFSLTEREPD
jgi:catechol 2,3-dioxygenase-like lactoylglutathione lyase family enzyme